VLHVEPGGLAERGCKLIGEGAGAVAPRRVVANQLEGQHGERRLPGTLTRHADLRDEAKSPTGRRDDDVLTPAIVASDPINPERLSG